MGNCVSSKNRSKSSNDIDIGLINIYNILNIATVYVSLNNTQYGYDYLRGVIEYFAGNKIDILCIQGVTPDMVESLNDLIEEFTTETNHLYSTVIKHSKTHSGSIEATWSSSNNNSIDNINSVIISKHRIINYVKVKLSNPNNIFSTTHYIVLANINFNNILLSIYTLCLYDNVANVDNSLLRKQHIDELNDIISENRNNLKNNRIKDDAENRNIHIICGNLNIMESLDGDVNREYIYLFRKLKQIDTHSYVANQRDIKLKNDVTNIYGSITSYISIGVTTDDNSVYSIKDLTNILYRESKIAIVNSNAIQISNMDHYLTTTTFKLVESH